MGEVIPAESLKYIAEIFPKYLPKVLRTLEDLKKQLGDSERKRKERLDAIRREQIKSISSAKEQFRELLPEAQRLLETAQRKSKGAKDYVEDLLVEISIHSREELEEFVRKLPKSGRQSLGSDHPLLKFCKRIEDCVDQAQQALTELKEADDAAKKALAKLDGIMEKVKEEIETERNMAAKAEKKASYWTIGLGVFALLAGLVAVAPFVLPAGTLTTVASVGVALGMSEVTISNIGVVALIACGTLSAATLWQGWEWCDHQHATQVCDENLEKVKLAQQPIKDLRGALIKCDHLSLEMFVDEMQRKLKAFSSSVKGDHFEIIHVMKKLDRFLKVAASYRTTE
eukprot:scpid81504/ scgid21803/ 